MIATRKNSENGIPSRSHTGTSKSSAAASPIYLQYWGGLQGEWEESRATNRAPARAEYMLQSPRFAFEGAFYNIADYRTPSRQEDEP